MAVHPATARPDRRRVGPRSVPVAVVAVVAALALGACGGDLQTRTRDMASEVRSQAQGQLDEAVQARLDDARERFGGQVDVEGVCALVADDRLTRSERGRLEVAVDLGEALGLPAEVTRAGRTVLDATDGATGQVGRLQEACADVGTNMDADVDGDG